MDLHNISESEFAEYVDGKSPISFLQSPQIAQRRLNDGWRSEVLGLFDGNTLVAATRIYIKPLPFGYKKLEVLQGPIVDFSREKYTSEFLEQLKQYASRVKAVQLEITPNLPRVHRDNSANIVEDGYNSSLVEKEFITAGYEKVPYDVSDNRPDVFRWIFVKNLSGISSVGELEKSFSSSTKRSIKRAESSGITIRELPTNEVTVFHDIIEKTGERWDFKARSIDYYVELLSSFGAEDSRVFIAEISRENYRKYLDDLINKQTKIVSETGDDKVKNKAQSDKTHYQEIANNIDSLPDPIVLAGTVVLRYGDEVTHLFSGSYKEHAFLRATSLLRYHALIYALNLGASRFNFYGTKGNHTGHPKEEGIFQFKRGFGGNVEEQIGLFVYTPRPFINIMFKVLSKLRRLLQ